MEKIDYFEMRSGLFNGRQHIVNHVDMILGLSDSLRSKVSGNRDLVFLSSTGKNFLVSEIDKMSKEGIIETRSQVLRESLFATEWQQITLLCGEEYITPEKIESREDIDEILNVSIDIWMDKTNDLAEFAKTTSAIVLLRDWNPVVVDRIVVRRRPTNAELRTLPVAINSRRVLSTRYSSEISWKIFAERICKNSYVKEHLKETQKGVCAVCGNKLSDHIVIHHTDYDHRCEFCNSGLDWRIPGTRVQPDCERCYIFHKQWFEECVSRLKAVHNGCNYFVDCIF